MSEVMSETKPTTSVNLLILVVGMAALAVATFFAVYTLTGVLAPPPAPAPVLSANEITSLSGLDFSNVEGAFCKVPVTGESRAAAEPDRRIVRSRQIATTPMSVEEAAEQLEIAAGSFLVFTNAETDAINIIHRLDDSNFGLIEPS